MDQSDGGVAPVPVPPVPVPVVPADMPGSVDGDIVPVVPVVVLGAVVPVGSDIVVPGDVVVDPERRDERRELRSFRALGVVFIASVPGEVVCGDIVSVVERGVVDCMVVPGDAPAPVVDVCAMAAPGRASAAAAMVSGTIRIRSLLDIDEYDCPL